MHSCVTFSFLMRQFITICHSNHLMYSAFQMKNGVTLYFGIVLQNHLNDC
jgi:Na+/melibiose symporter-like transporter